MISSADWALISALYISSYISSGISGTLAPILSATCDNQFQNHKPIVEYFVPVAELYIEKKNS